MPHIIDVTEGTISSPEEKYYWMKGRSYSLGARDLEGFYDRVKEMDIFDLLARVARYKPFWLKDSDERSARRILDDPSWNALRDLLIKHDFMVERRDVPAAGRPGAFYHIKNRQQLLSVEDIPTELFEEMMDIGYEIERDKYPPIFFLKLCVSYTMSSLFSIVAI